MRGKLSQSWAELKASKTEWRKSNLALVLAATFICGVWAGGKLF